MTCKVDSVLDIFSRPEGRSRAIEWFKNHGITKIYLESYRHKRLADFSVLSEIRKEFQAAGLEVAGCITTTQMSKRPATWEITTCFTDPTAHEFLQYVVEETAKIFDQIILDDFFFTTCTCQYCIDAKGVLSWPEFRASQMLEIALKRVILPGRTINPRVKFIIKYPKWYETYYEAGYDILRETDLFDRIWVGTETREPDSPEAGRTPQTAAFWIQGWLNRVGGDKCGGAWFDPIDTRPETFLEQARQSILGGAQECLLHCYDYLATKTPGLAIHGKDTEIKNGLADAAAFCTERPELTRLAETLSTLSPYGVLVPKYPNDDTTQEAYLPSFVGMLGIPVLPSATLAVAPSAFLGIQCRNFPGLTGYLKNALTAHRPLVLTSALLKSLGNDDLAELPIRQLLASCKSGIVERSIDHLILLDCPDDLWQLTTMPLTELNAVRNLLLRPFNIEFMAPAKVSLHLFKDSTRGCEVIENFNDFPVEITIRFTEDTACRRTLALTLPVEAATLTVIAENTFRLKLTPRALALLTWHKAE